MHTNRFTCACCAINIHCDTKAPRSKSHPESFIVSVSPFPQEFKLISDCSSGATVKDVLFTNDQEPWSTYFPGLPFPLNGRNKYNLQSPEIIQPHTNHHHQLSAQRSVKEEEEGLPQTCGSGLRGLNSTRIRTTKQEQFYLKIAEINTSNGRKRHK